MPVPVEAPKIVLLGPTGVGKTMVSFHVATKYSVPIVSVDSRQCYRLMDIGTAKPTPFELSSLKHYNISELDPSVNESAGRFLDRLETYHLEQDDPFHFFVGGSTLHIQSILFGLDEGLPKANVERVEYLSNLARSNPGRIKDMLQYVDPNYAATMEGFNVQRTVRALDVWAQTGIPFSQFHSKSFKTEPVNSLVLGLQRPRDILYKRAEERVDQMMANGLLAEIEGLLNSGYSFSNPGLSGVGYKEFEPFFLGQKSLDECVSDIKMATRRYIKRQETWFKRWKFIHWFNAENVDMSVLLQQIDHKITNFLAN